VGKDVAGKAGPGSAPEAVERLLHRWQERSEGLPAWLLALRRGQADFAVATKGRPWTIEVRLDGDTPWRVGITAEGEIVCPLPLPRPDERPDVRIQGDSCSVARFMLGQRTLEEAMIDGLVVVPSSSTPLDGLERLRRLVAIQFNKLVAGPSVGLVFVARRWLWRVQARTAHIGALIEGASPAFLAMATTFVVSSALAAPFAGNGRSGQAARIPTAIQAAVVHPTGAPPVGLGLPANSRTNAASANPVVRVGKQPSVAARPDRNETVTTALDRGNVLRTGLDNERPAPGGGETYLFVELTCDSKVRAAVCDVLLGMPVPTQER
jgi:hypothetical protein